ncbi:hypothetical protein AXF42_Ash012917 [Apostasia shenzhenica]|uniref:Pentatricopeptide repeat-containing protein n=1 Tax=Apostasia shenzhenica TaxID=1088818 RepID=A0A2I0ARL7_9ASPA|nr:hypothetical protein AXF42_Ash012917 [Apostasia shenzhenica]
MTFEAYFQALCRSERLEHAEILLKEAAEKHLESEVCVQKSFINALFRSCRHVESIRFFEAKKKKKIGSWISGRDSFPRGERVMGQGLPQGQVASWGDDLQGLRAKRPGDGFGRACNAFLSVLF